MTQPLSESAHKSLVELLPWYVNGTLAGDEHDAVEKHIGNCAECFANVDMLSRVRDSIRNDSPAPLVPQPRAETLLTALDGVEHGTTSRASWKWYAAAASVLVFLAATWVTLQPEATTGGAPAIYQTATSDDTGSPIRYVIELHFEPDTSSGERKASLVSIDAEETAIARSDGSYRIMLGSGPETLAELEQRIDAIVSRPEISSARVVAVQLPVE